jgi:MFS family permease
MRRVHYAWVVAGTSFVALVMTAGFRSTAGVLLVPLHEEFGWSYTTISLAVSINLVVFGLGAPFAAAFVERFGLRRVMIDALAVVAVGSLLTVLMDSPWQLFLLWGIVIGAATGAISVPLAAIVSTRWFVSRRGLVTGLLGASFASGQLVFLPLLAWIVTSAGWRWAAVAVSAAALGLVLPLVALLMRDRPRDIGLRPFGASEDDPEPPPLVNPFGAALGGLRLGAHSGTFWLLFGSFFICGATTSGLISTHLIPAAHDHGIGEVTAAGLLALMGVFDIVGTTLSGWLTDRYDSRWLLFWYYGLRGLSLIALPFAFDARGAGLIVFAVFYGLDWVATVPPTVALTAQTFGRENVGIVFGWIFAAHQIGAAVAAFTAGAARTALGDYGSSFVAAGLLCLIASVLVLRIARSPGPARPAEIPVTF